MVSVVGNEHGVVSRPAPVNIADDGAWCLAGAVHGARLIVEPRLPHSFLFGRICFVPGTTSTALPSFSHDQHHGHPAHRCRALCDVRASGHCHSSIRVHLSSKLRLSVRAYSERERRAGGMGAPNLPCPVSLSQSRTSVKDTRPWKLYTLLGMCGDVKCICHSIRWMDCDNAQLATVDNKTLADVDTVLRCVLPYPC